MKYKLPLVTVVTVNYNGKHLLKNCLDSLLALDYPEGKLEIIMVDNCSKDESVEYTKIRYPEVKIIKNDINNYCRANNLAIAQSKGRYIALLNNDTKVDKDWLVELVNVMKMDSKVGAVGSKILFMDGRLQSAGHMECPNYYRTDKGFLEEDKGQYNELKEVASVSNCSVLYRREALDKIGKFDEDFVMYMEDVDIAFRLKKRGWTIWYAPKSITYHTLHGSRQDVQERQFYVERNRLLFIAKYSPDKLPEYLCGFGGVVKFKYLDFIKILISIFDKLMEKRNSKNNIDLLTQLQKSIETIYDYRQLSFREELENLSAGMRQELLVKETQLNSLQEILKTKDGELHHRLTELKVRDEQLKNQQEEILRLEKDARDRENNLSNLSEEIKKQESIIDSKEGKLKSQQGIIEVLQKGIQDKSERTDSLTEELRNQEAQFKAQQEAIRDKDKQIESYLMELKVQNEQIIRHQEVRAAKEESISNQDLILASKDEQLKNQQEEILRLEKDARDRENNLSNLSEEIKGKDSIIGAKEEYIQNQNSIIGSKEEQIQILYKELLNKETRLSSLRNSLTANEEKIKRQLMELNIKDGQLKDQKEMIMALDKEIKDKDEKNRQQHNELDIRNNQLNALELKIRVQEQGSSKQMDELKDKDERLAGKDAIIAARNEEISKIYNSESYRLIVKPVIWPLLSFIKRAMRIPKKIISFLNSVFKKDKNNKEKSICIAQMHAKNIAARYGNDNEYDIKIFNNSFEEKKFKLVLDIWPYRNQFHPQRHFAYFSLEAAVEPKEEDVVRIVYDWEKNISLFVNNEKKQYSDFWRGNMKSVEFYTVEAVLYDEEGKSVDRLNIMQKLEK